MTGLDAIVTSPEVHETVVGQPVERIDGWEKVTGAARFADDIEFGPGLLYAFIVEPDTGSKDSRHGLLRERSAAVSAPAVSGSAAGMGAAVGKRGGMCCCGSIPVSPRHGLRKRCRRA